MADTISVQQLHARHEAGERLHVLDVRTPAEFRACHVSIARNRPLESLDIESIRREHAGVNAPLFVLCKGGTRSKAACSKLVAAGLPVVNVEGGTDAWIQAGLPVQKGRKAMAIDRQMRIVAGTLVVLGVALTPIHWAFVLLSAGVGCGLVFAGVTDICPMMGLLARAPWNQVSREASGAACASGGAPDASTR